MATIYQCPDRIASEADKLAWLRSTLGQSRQWLQSQPGYRDAQAAIELISGQNRDTAPVGLSGVVCGEVRRDLRELVETLSNLKAVAAVKTENKDLYPEAGQFNTLQKCWWYMSRPEEAIKGATQYAFGLGTGFLVTEWDPNFHGEGRGNVRLSAYSRDCVLPVQLPADGDYQKAYAVHMVVETPIALAARKWWASRNKIVADRQSPSWMAKGMDTVKQFLSPILHVFGVGKNEQTRDPIFPTVDLVTTFVDDYSINETGQPITMGEPGTSWSYTVPSMGTKVYAGINDDQGNKLYRDVTTQESRLYPMRRMIVWCNSTVLYDDTSYWWHGQVPAVPLSFDKWIWDATGSPASKDVAELEASATRLMRAVDDAANTRLDPPMLADDGVVSEDEAAEFSVRIPGQMVRRSAALGKGIEPMLPAEFYNLPAYIPAYIDSLIARIQRIMGVQDMNAMAKARQIPSADTIEKIQEVAGPIMVGMGNALEIALQKVGEQWKFLNMQFMTVQRKLQLLGDDGVNPTDYDYDPTTLVPSHMPSEAEKKAKGEHSDYSQLERAKRYANQFYYFIVPGSLLQITQMSQKLLVWMMYQNNFPIDPWTVAEMFNIPNFGPAPVGSNTVMERYVAWQRIKTEAAQALAQATSQGDSAGAAAGGGDGGGPVGRPHTFQKPPSIEQKSGPEGPRATIATS